MTGRRYNCRCGKKRYRDEEAALAAAAQDSAEHGEACTAYRCPGGLAWHVTSSGYLPQALRTVGRRLAHELLTAGVVELPDFRVRVIRDERKRRRLDRVAADLVTAGIAGEDRPGALRAADRDALRRIVQVGLDAYLAER
jgi:hypothetical protein